MATDRRHIPLDVSRERSLIMRGFAIMFIALHNYCHLMTFVVRENESTFSDRQVENFFTQATTWSKEWIYNYFSFLGWYGVPVFMFLTAYGLVRKYECDTSRPLSRGTFIYDNWLKLLALLLPGVLYYVASYLFLCVLHNSTPDGFYIFEEFFLLTFLNDALYPWIDTIPGVYWYFGLTLEFYLLYAFAIYRRNPYWLVWMTIASVALQLAVLPAEWNNNSQMYLIWVRQNVTGWMLPFAFGILFARSKDISRPLLMLVIVAAVALFFPTMSHPMLWQLSLLCAVVTALAVAWVSYKIPYWRDVWMWIGRLSPFIFVAHPIVRSLMWRNLAPHSAPSGRLFLVYVVSVFAIALVYKAIWARVTPRLRKWFAPLRPKPEKKLTY